MFVIHPPPFNSRKVSLTPFHPFSLSIAPPTSLLFSSLDSYSPEQRGIVRDSPHLVKGLPQLNSISFPHKDILCAFGFSIVLLVLLLLLLLFWLGFQKGRRCINLLLPATVISNIGESQPTRVFILPLPRATLDRRERASSTTPLE